VKARHCPSLVDLRSGEVKIKCGSTASWHGHQRRADKYCEHDYVVKWHFYLFCRRHLAAVNAPLVVSVPLREPFEASKMSLKHCQKR